MTTLPRPIFAIALSFSLLAVSCGNETLNSTADPLALAPTQSSTTATVPSLSETPAADASSSDTSADDPTVESQADASTAAQPAELSGSSGDLPLPASPVELAVALSEAERAVRQPDLSDDEVRQWGRRQQRLYRSLAVNSEWTDEVLTSVDDDVAASVELNLVARENLSSLGHSENLSETIPAWEIVEPLPPEELIALYKNAEAATGVSWEFLAAINLVETRMGRIRGLSTAGAVGPMQFLPTTWAECCEGDPTIPADAIMGAAQYLVDRGGPDNMPKAIRGYNNSANYVNAVTAYAEVIMNDERAYWGYHGWGVYFLSAAGLVEIPIGYFEPEPVNASEWIAENPDALVDS